MTNQPIPIVWSIAGSDSSGGSGLQADIRTLAALGVHGCSVVTAVTAQGLASGHAVEPMSLGAVSGQVGALRRDLPPAAIKVGMLGPASVVAAVAAALRDIKAPVVCDPVLRSSSGLDLLEPKALGTLVDGLLPRVDLLTPNRAEAAALTGLPCGLPAEVEAAAGVLLARGVRAVAITGGDEAGELCQDYFADRKSTAWLTSARIGDISARGTGCVLSSAIAAGLAQGLGPLDALVMAKAYVNAALRAAVPLGGDRAVLIHRPSAETAADMPWLTATAAGGAERPQFPPCDGPPLGFYPIVDRAEWLERLLPMGVTTAQLRVKDLAGDRLEEEVRSAIACARRFDCRLFINDHWELALRHGAYALHLGQGDLDRVDIGRLEAAGIRLGVSTHSYSELARALALRPSCIALGPVYETTSKVMPFAPQGLANLRLWRRLVDGPLVAIGGISLERAQETLACGPDAIAVISDISGAADVEARVKDWLALFPCQREPGSAP